METVAGSEETRREMDAALQAWLDAPGALEQRREARRHILRLARVRTEEGTFRCVVLDISHYGARLQLAAPLFDSRSASRRSIELLIEPLSSRWDIRESFGPLRGEIVWQNMTTMGVRFTGDPLHARATHEQR